MIATILLAAATMQPAGAPAVQSPVEAERAFAADAQGLGQWTAFRKWAAEDAVMFIPQPVNAQQFLEGLDDPAEAVFWWPGRSYLSCDGGHAVNSGPWVRQGGKFVGYYSTVWRRGADGWRWIYDGGDLLESPRAEGGEVAPRVASCNGRPTAAQPLAAPQGGHSGHGRSGDGTLAWSWTVGPDGARRFVAQLWNGRSLETVIDDRIAAPPKR